MKILTKKIMRSNLNKNFIIVCCLLLLAGIVGYRWYYFIPTTVDNVNLKDFPLSIGDWQGKDLPLKERVYELLETRNLIMRDYVNSQGKIINLYIIYSQDNRKVSHPPEICLQSEGAVVVQKSEIAVSKNIKATKMILEKEGSRQVVLFWYKVGSAYTPSYIRQQIKVSFGRLLGKKVSSALIRLVIPIEASLSEKQTFEKLISFCILLEPLLSQYLP
ncbi:MAG: EpsI family protein [Candidatus Omnitrophica bacterium]|nr:EpsI family protein [Candidatus Omnitrophota bacterium]